MVESLSTPSISRPRLATRSDLYAARDGLLRRGTFKVDRTLPGTVHRIVDRGRSDPESVLSAVDPFGFVSHLSAMAYHGLSNRLPKVVGLKGPLGCLTQARYGITWGPIGSAIACLKEVLDYTGDRP